MIRTVIAGIVAALALYTSYVVFGRLVKALESGEWSARGFVFRRHSEPARYWLAIAVMMGYVGIGVVGAFTLLYAILEQA
jgi:hypothetical protein